MKLETVFLWLLTPILLVGFVAAAAGAWLDSPAWLKLGAVALGVAFALAMLPLTLLGVVTVWQRVRGRSGA